MDNLTAFETQAANTIRPYVHQMCAQVKKNNTDPYAVEVMAYTIMALAQNTTLRAAPMDLSYNEALELSLMVITDKGGAMRYLKWPCLHGPLGKAIKELKGLAKAGDPAFIARLRQNMLIEMQAFIDTESA